MSDLTYPSVKGTCPSCGLDYLFLGNGGYVTCSVLECANPGAAGERLADGKVIPVEDIDYEAANRRLLQRLSAARFDSREAAQAIVDAALHLPTEEEA